MKGYKTMKIMKIVKITKIENDSLLYDIETMKNHNFFANGILVHNSNFQVSITADEVKYGKRTAWLTPGEGFFDWETVVKRDHIKSFVESVQKELVGTDDRIDIFGELFGPGVQKRIQYGVQKDIKFFEMRKNGIWIAPIDFEHFLLKHNAFELHVPIFTYIKGLEEAIAFETTIPTRLFVKHEGTNLEEAQECEGVVIKPYNDVVYERRKKVIIKKKNELFREKMKCGGQNKDRVPKTVSPLQEEFLLYINENRMAGIVSKFGEPSEMKDIGKYISLLANDGFNDFAKDQGWDLADISKTGRSAYVSMVGAVALPLIKKYL